MKVEDLKSLTTKILHTLEATDAINQYAQFVSGLQRVLKQGQRGESLPTEALFNALGKFDEIELTYSESKLFEALGYREAVGEMAVTNLSKILRDENFDPAGVVQRVTAEFQKFDSFVNRNNNLQAGLQNIETAVSDDLRDGEALLEITFTDGAAVETIVDFEEWIDSWSKILRSFTIYAGARPEASRIIFVQKSSPLIIDIATVGAAVFAIGKAADMVLEKIERYLRIKKQIEEIKKLKLENKQIAIQLAKEAEGFSAKAASEITDHLAPLTADTSDEEKARSENEVRAGLNIAIKKLFIFVEKGGRVDCPCSEDDATNEDTEKVFVEIRRLQANIDQLRLPAVGGGSESD